MFDEADELQTALPVSGLIGNVEFANDRRRHAFAMHLVHQRGKAVGQIE